MAFIFSLFLSIGCGARSFSWLSQIDNVRKNSWVNSLNKSTVNSSCVDCASCGTMLMKYVINCSCIS